MDLQTARLHIWHTAWLLDKGEKCNFESSRAKVVGSEAEWRAGHRCVQILRGQGVTGEAAVMRFVMGCKDERYPARPGACAQFVELFRVLVNLIRVSLSKRLPARGIMSKPLAQVGTGRDVFQPMVDGGVLLAKASGPQAVSQDPRAVASRRRVIGSLRFDIFSRKPRHCLFARM